MLLGMAGFALVFLSAGLMLGLAFLHRKSSSSFRDIPAFSRLSKAIGRAVENGSRLHISLGHGSLTTPQSGASLVGLSMLRRLADLTSASDRPPIATSGDATIAILSQDALQSSYQNTALGAYDVTASRLTGLTPFSYAAGALSVMMDENITSNVLIGNFGIEVGLLTDAAERQDTFNLAVSDNLSAQAVVYASARDLLIGEELYAAGAYVEAGPLHATSLTVQDILRWVIVGIILLSALLKLTGLL